MKKFKELMRRPVTLGEFMVFCIGFAGATWFWANEPDPAAYAKVIKEKAKKKGYTTVKLDDIPADPDESEVEEVLSWD